MKVLVLHSLPPAATDHGRAVWEFDLSEAAQAIAQVLPDAVIAGVRGDLQEVMTLLAAQKPDIVFNLCEAPNGRPELESHVAALLEWSGVRFTGSGCETLALCRRKDWANAVLGAAGVPVPRSNVFPCIVKPVNEDGSAGIYTDSICEDELSLERARSRLYWPAMVEEFLPGREFAVSLWGRTEPDYASIGETRFKQGLRLNTYAAKWDIESEDFANSPLFYDVELDRKLRDDLIAAAKGAWRAVEACGYIRVDIRLDSLGIPRVLDVNPNPEMSPGVGIHRAVTEAGWTWERFVKQQLEWA
jgi:D-alanine-D-alanine ligase